MNAMNIAFMMNMTSVNRSIRRQSVGEEMINHAYYYRADPGFRIRDPAPPFVLSPTPHIHLLST